MKPRSSPLVLFDIDGTLLKTGGAGREAMVVAMDRLFGRPDAFDGVSFAGAVDPGIVGEALDRIGQVATPAVISTFRRAYFSALRRSLARAGAEGRTSLCPGVREAVEALRGRATLGLMTGNWRRSAAQKLDAVSLGEPFSGAVGAFGDDAAVRDALLPFAVRRATRRGPRPGVVIVIGDTPADVGAARAGAAALGRHGPEVIAVAVNTGFSTREALVRSEPDLLLEDLACGWPALDALVRRLS